MEQFTTTDQKVIKLLEREPSTRNSNLLLTWRLRQKYHGVGHRVGYEEMKDLPQMTTIARSRRKYRDQYPPVKEVDKYRRNRENQMRDHYAN